MSPHLDWPFMTTISKIIALSHAGPLPYFAFPHSIYHFLFYYFVAVIFFLYYDIKPHEDSSFFFSFLFFVVVVIILACRTMPLR